MPFGEPALMDEQQRADIRAAKALINYHIQSFKEALNAADLEPIKTEVKVSETESYYLGTDFLLRHTNGHLVLEQQIYDLMKLLRIVTALSHLTNPNFIEGIARQAQTASA